jgi:ketosteroid isomerase-like protein
MAILLVAASVLAQTASPRGASKPEIETAAIIQKADQALAQAFVKRDLAVLEQMYADTYVFTDQNGRVSGKKELLDSFGTGAINIKSQDITDVSIHVYGDAAIETGKLTTTATRDGRDASGTYRFTRVWVKQNGQWQTAAFQETRPQ